MTAVANGNGAAAPRRQQTLPPARLADRPLLTTPTELHRPESLDTERERLSRQPLLGLEGLALVAPLAALIAFGAGGAQRSVLVLDPLATFALAPIVMIAFWWEDWPGTRLRASWSGWFDTLLIAAAAVLLTGVAQIVVGRLDLGGIFNPTPGQGRTPTFPATMPLGGAAFVAMIQLTLVTEGWPLRRLGRVVGGLLALAFSWASALAVYFALIDFTPPPGSGLTRRHGWLSNGELGAVLVFVGLWQVWLFVVWRGWPFARLERRWQRLLAGNAAVISGAMATYALGRAAGVSPGTLSAVAGSVIAAALLLAMLFEGWLPVRRTPGSDRFALSGIVLLVGCALYLVLRADADHLRGAQAKPSEWVAHATLNAIGVAVILHVAVGRRWPFAR